MRLTFPSAFAIGSLLMSFGLTPSHAQTARSTDTGDKLVYVVNPGGGGTNAPQRSVTAYRVGSDGVLVSVSDPPAPPSMGSPAVTAPTGEDAGRSIAGGGISVPGWEGKVDPGAAKQGQTVKDDKFAPEGSGMRITTGPAVTYWNAKNVATGDYTVSATFTEPKYMNLNDHPHPYGVVIAGNDLGTATGSLLYCGAYGSGKFIVRGFGPDAFQMGGRPPVANDAVHKAAGPGEPVTQVIALAVKGDSVTCSINGTVVATYAKSELVVAGKLKSTDGVYGVRSAHNTDVVVTDLKMTKP